jgi:hypothetical protein
MSSAPPTAQTGSAAELQAKASADLQAKALLDWMQNRVGGDGGEIAVRDVLRLGPSATRRLDEAEAALETLARHGRTEDVSSRPRVIRVCRERDRHETCDAATVATVPGAKAETVANAAPQAPQPENSAPGAPSVATSRETPSISASGPAAWREALVALSPDHDPCPGFQSGAWPRVHANALAFVEELGNRAAELGWGAEELFGVDPVVGVERPKSCGALMVSRGHRVVQVRADQIRFANRFAVRRCSKSRPTTPVWDFDAR